MLSVDAQPDAADPLATATAVGVATHLLVARLAARFGTPTPAEILTCGRAWLAAPALGIPNRQAFRAQVLSLAAVYYAQFARPGWRLVGSETIIGDVAFDLVWERGRTIEADELKTGRLRHADLVRLQRQVEGQVSAGAHEWGASFKGVRGVVLARPQQSFFVAP